VLAALLLVRVERDDHPVLVVHLRGPVARPVLAVASRPALK
jgi:hypothetical protein